jgi:hypothetical protein
MVSSPYTASRMLMKIWRKSKPLCRMPQSQTGDLKWDGDGAPTI